ncbi:MAG: hypothetical protein AAGA21_25275 [Pseudomonadota bacterium]
MLRYRWLCAGVLTLCWILIGGWSPGLAATAEEGCDRLFVPEGYELTCTLTRKAGDHDWEVAVHPVDGTFASLSKLTLSPVDETVTDPAAWLERQVKIDVTGLEDALTSFLDDEDNPFSDESWWTSLQGLKDVVHSISDLPLDACEEPRQSSGEGWVIDCDWGIGSLRQFLTVRLVEQEDTFYALRIQSMNQKRHRHLQAIANSF